MGIAATLASILGLIAFMDAVVQQDWTRALFALAFVCFTSTLVVVCAVVGTERR